MTTILKEESCHSRNKMRKKTPRRPNERAIAAKWRIKKLHQQQKHLVDAAASKNETEWLAASLADVYETHRKFYLLGVNVHKIYIAAKRTRNTVTLVLLLPASSSRINISTWISLFDWGFIATVIVEVSVRYTLNEDFVFLAFSHFFWYHLSFSFFLPVKNFIRLNCLK